MSPSPGVMSIPPELSDQMRRGNVVLFVGAGLSIGAGLPGWEALIRPLAERIGYEGHNLLEAAQFYENRLGRNALISHLRDRLDTTNIEPTESHALLTRLPVNTVFTTNLDDLLERAYHQARRRVNLVAAAPALPHWDESEVNLVKLHGTYDRPETFIVTQQDYHTFYQDNALIVQQLGALLTTKTFLFIGYSVRDPDFNQIYDQLGADLGEHQRRPYLVTFGLDELRMQNLERRGYHVVNLPEEGDPNALLAAWLQALLDTVAGPESEAGTAAPSAAPRPQPDPGAPRPAASAPQPSATPPQQSGGFPQINVSSRISLTEQEIALLQHVHQGFDEVLIEKEFGEGLSGARVFLTSPSKGVRAIARQVTKLGATPELRQERDNYEKYVRDFLPVYAARVERYCDQGDLAGLNYVFVGGEALGEMMDSLEYYRTHTAEQVIEMLDALLDRALRPWYGQHENLPPRFFADEYSRHLVTHLQLKLRPGSLDALWPAGRSPQVDPNYQQVTVDDILREYKAMQPGTLLSVEGLVVTRVKRDRVNLRGPGAQGPFLHVNFPPASNAAQGLEVESHVGLRGEVVHNRHTQMEKIVRAVFPELSPAVASERIELPGVPGTYPNPLSVYPDVLDMPLKGRASYTHGDLHPLNVLVNVLRRDLGRGWLIDFASVEKRHNIFDFVVLETYLRVWELGRITPPLSPEACARFEEALNAATLDPSVTPPAEPRLLKAYQVILALRRIARNYMARDSDFLDQYFPALFLYCLGMMRHYQHDGPQAARWAFIAACVLGKEKWIIQEGCLDKIRKLWRKARTKCLGIGCIVVLIVLMVVFIIGLLYGPTPDDLPVTPNSAVSPSIATVQVEIDGQPIDVDKVQSVTCTTPQSAPHIIKIKLWEADSTPFPPIFAYSWSFAPPDSYNAQREGSGNFEIPYFAPCELDHQTVSVEIHQGENTLSTISILFDITK